MSFRRKRDEWDEFRRRHRAEFRACGVPDYVLAKKMRFLVFLDHGYDEWGWAENPHHACFNGADLTDEQIGRLAELVCTHVDERYRVAITSRWQRTA